MSVPFASISTMLAVFTVRRAAPFRRDTASLVSQSGRKTRLTLTELQSYGLILLCQRLYHLMLRFWLPLVQSVSDSLTQQRCISGLFQVITTPGYNVNLLLSFVLALTASLSFVLALAYLFTL